MFPHTQQTIYIYSIYICTHTYTTEYYSAFKKKEGNPAICDNTDEPYIFTHTHTHMQWNIIQPLKRERNPAICDNMDEPRGHYVK